MNYLHVSEDNISSGPALYFPCTNLNILFPNKQPSIHPKLLWIISSNSNNPLQIGYSQFIRRSLQSSWYKQVPTHCLSLFATSAEDLPDSAIFSFAMNYTKTTWFLQSTFINILHINPRMASIRFQDNSYLPWTVFLIHPCSYTVPKLLPLSSVLTLLSQNIRTDWSLPGSLLSSPLRIWSSHHPHVFQV